MVKTVLVTIYCIFVSVQRNYGAQFLTCKISEYVENYFNFPHCEIKNFWLNKAIDN